MLLQDATSAEQVAAALAAGDEELREDIDDKLQDAKSSWEHSGRGYSDEHDPVDFEELTNIEAFVDSVIEQSPADHDLNTVPRNNVDQALFDAARRGRRRGLYGPFYIDDHGGRGFSYEIERYGSYFFSDRYFPSNAEFIPASIARDFWLSLGKEYDWENRTALEDNFATGPGTTSYVGAEEESFSEWCRDIVGEFIQEVITKDPEKAKETFFAALAREDAALAERLKGTQLDDDELNGLIATWFEDDEGKESTLDTIREYFATMDSGSTEERTVVAVVTKQDIAAMGITRGTLFENAPWQLVRLHPADLRMEGTLMGHCVGKAGMGYIKALKDGQVEIWSLRSRDNKPRFTLEVDPRFWTVEDEVARGVYNRVIRAEDAADEILIRRGERIAQLKGKANREVGYADVRKTGGVKFPDEPSFWTHLLESLRVDPIAVTDFSAYETLLTQGINPRDAAAVYAWATPHGGAVRAKRVTPNGDQCTGFDLPYRPRVISRNRRSSKRRTTRRRSSRIRS